ncbi:GGDEF domain-containing protein [Bacillus suaedae]|uniref:Diguanylate cyclase n=1 Tax=Halalkalibacter suaedae TaxID=2822140 RepID=A0A941AMG7_9BACI|nr:diguanylate cyclase [Bacillus suaedae]
MVRELFINVMILTAFLFLYYQFKQDSLFTRNSSVRRKIFVGLLSGALGILLMQFSIKVDTETLVDLRQIPVMLVAIYGGWLPTIIAGTLILLARFIMGVTMSAMLAVVLMILSIVCYLYVFRSYQKIWKPTFLSIIVSNIIFTLLTYYLIDTMSMFIYVNIVYWIVSLIGGGFAVYMTEYLRRTTQLFKEYERGSRMDPLTGLNNVRSFDDAINDATKRVNQNQEELSLLVIDIDFFKKVNDTYGHPEGDVILKQIGDILVNVSRPFDIVSRNGGEEFTVILNNCSHHIAIGIAERIKSTVENHSFLINEGKQKITITVSIGVASYPDTTKDINQLYRIADLALYKAKEQGRNRVCSG